MSDPERLAFERWLNQGHHCGCNDNMWKSWLARSLLDAARCNDTAPVAPIGDDSRDAALFRVLVSSCHAFDAKAFDDSNQPGTLIATFRHKAVTHPDMAAQVRSLIEGYVSRLAAVAAQGDKC